MREVVGHLHRGRRLAPDRVRLARSIAREMGLSESEVGLVGFAASVHDLGMKSLGDRLESSVSPLSRDERRALERHPALSAEMLGPLESVGVVRDIVLSHHEWWDGSGYPQGLNEEQIPLGSRILAVVDTYESMTVGRKHRSPVTRADALSELALLSGRQFDPRVVVALERALVQLDRESGAAVADPPAQTRG
jgi:HD-GYP domain-containing protein (c-di-GMP phosphodiesterase class II)